MQIVLYTLWLKSQALFSSSCKENGYAPETAAHIRFSRSGLISGGYYRVKQLLRALVAPGQVQVSEHGFERCGGVVLGLAGPTGHAVDVAVASTLINRMLLLSEQWQNHTGGPGLSRGLDHVDRGPVQVYDLVLAVSGEVGAHK